LTHGTASLTPVQCSGAVGLAIEKPYSTQGVLLPQFSLVHLREHAMTQSNCEKMPS